MKTKTIVVVQRKQEEKVATL